MSDKLRILLVDDNEVNLDVLGRRLERKDCEVVAVTSGSLALATLREAQFDAVVLDLRMPEMTGHEVLHEIRKTHTQIQLPVVMATAETDPDEMIRALEGGANDYVTKPIDAAVLLARIRAQLRARLPVQSRPPLAAPSAPLAIGSVIQQRYRLDALLGSGGFGRVYKARHLKLDTDIALKLLHPHLLTTESIRRRFEQEAVSTCRVKHANAVQVLDAGATESGLPYLVMELIEGPTLAMVLEQERCFRLQRVAEILVPVCSVLEEAHRVGVVHRDVKPANIMLTRVGDSELVKVLDFGIAKFIDREQQLGLTGDTIVGTPLYMSPEALLGQPTSKASDVYSVGVTAYLMLTGDTPHGAPSNNPFEQAIRQVSSQPAPLASARPDLPAAVANAVMGAMARSAADRPTLRELSETLARFGQIFHESTWPPTRAAAAPLQTGVPTVHVESSSSPPHESGVVPSDRSSGELEVSDEDRPARRSRP